MAKAAKLPRDVNRRAKRVVDTATKQIDLRGAIVEDKVTGFKGVVTGVVHFLSGSVQAHVQPRAGKDGKLPDIWSFDLDRLKHLRAGPVKATPPDDTSHIQLGGTARDKVTGVRGILTEKAVYLNGCTHYIITAPGSKKDERIVACDWKRIEVVSSEPLIAQPAPDGPPKGGPSARVEREGDLSP